MRAIELAYRLGPLAVRDLVGGSASLAVSTAAFILGCAFAATGTFAWFAFFGILGVLSLTSSLPVLRAAMRQHEGFAPPEVVPEFDRKAA